MGLTKALFVLCSTVIALTSVAICAQTYPNKPIRFITPYPPGGTTDILARLIGQRMSEDWKQPVIVDAKPGAGGNIGTDLVAKAAPDGYTILMGASGPLSINVTLFDKLPYDPVKDLAPVIHVASVPLVLVVNPSFPAKTVKEFIGLLKASPTKYSYASAGVGTPQHLTAELFNFMAGVKSVHVPYKGSGPAISDLMGGQVPYAFESMIPIVPQIQGGKVRAIAVTSATRSALLPQVPTVAESGVPNFEATAWYGVVAPAGVPKNIISALNQEMLKVMNTAEIKQKLAEMGSDSVGGPPERFGALIKSEIVKWGKVVKDSGARAE